MSANPQLLLVAGPNGAGKSTFSKKFSESGAIVFDVDLVIGRITARSPLLSKKQVYQAATQEFLDQAKTAIRQRQHFTLETNFRDESPLSVIDEFKRYGYTINMVYLTLEHTQQSIDRVNQRVKTADIMLMIRTSAKTMRSAYSTLSAMPIDLITWRSCSHPGKDLRYVPCSAFNIKASSI